MGSASFKAGTGIRAEGHAIRIDFYYRKVRCQEYLKLAPTRANLARAERMRHEILYRIDAGTFRYADFFPNSKKCALFAARLGQGQTVAHALKTWHDNEKNFVSHGTWVTYGYRINQLCAEFADILVEQLTRQHVKRYIGKLIERQLTASSIQGALVPLKRLYEELIEDEIVAKSPVPKIRARQLRAAPSSYQIDPFRPEEVKAILKAMARWPEIRLMYQFAFFSGLRISEYIALKWSDIDWFATPNPIVQVRRARVQGVEKITKTAAGSRDVDLNEIAISALKEMKAHSFLRGDYVFIYPGSGRPIPSHNKIFHLYWKPALKRAGVRYRNPRATRHTFASWLFSQGAHIGYVQRQLGHTSPMMTYKHYAKFMPSEARAFDLAKFVETYRID